MKREIPILCQLTEPELQRRQTDVLVKLGRSAAGSVELENGFRYLFPAEDTVLKELIEVINLERKCCPFLDFKLILKAGQDLAALELTDRDGTKEAIRELFNWN